MLIAVNELGYRIGESHQNAHISNLIVDQIRELHEDDRFSPAEISIELKLSINTIRKILRYERRAQTPDHWKTVRSVA